MTIDRRLVAGAAGLAILLAACGGASGPSATAAAPTEAAPTEAAPTEAAPTEAPTEAAPTEEPTDGDIGLPTGTNDLANRLPEEAAGVTFERVGFNGDQLGIYGAAAGLSDTELKPILDQYGKTIADVNFAIATPTSSDSTATVYALQIEGVDATDWMSAINMDPTDFNQETIAGKTVYSQAAGGFGVWAYPSGDTVYIILLGTPEVAEAIIGQLP